VNSFFDLISTEDCDVRTIFFYKEADMSATDISQRGI